MKNIKKYGWQHSRLDHHVCLEQINIKNCKILESLFQIKIRSWRNFGTTSGHVL